MSNGPVPKGVGLSQDDWDSIESASVRKALKTLAKKTLDNAKTQQVDDIGEIGDIGIDGGFFNTLNQTANQINKIQESLNNLNKQGLGFTRDGPFQKGIKNTTEALDQLLGSASRGAKTYEKLFSSLKGFAQMSAEIFDPNNPKGPETYNKQTRSLSDSLAEQAAILNDLGISLSDFSANIDSAVYSFGLNKQEVLDFNLQLKDLANNLQMMPGEVSRNFQLVSKNLAYDLSTIKDEFVKIQKLSLGTGVDTQTIIGTFGKRMDTIQGSSGAAASLNQILGDQIFSGNQLLRMTESERAEKIRAAFMENDALMDDIKAGGINSKFALQSVSEALPGMDDDQVRRFILTGKKDAVKRTVAGQAADQTTKAEQQAFRSELGNYRDAIKESTKEVLANLSEFKQVQIRARAQARREEIQTGRPGFISALGITSMLGPMPGGIDNVMAARAFDAGGGEDLKRAIQLSQMGVIGDEELKSIMRGLTNTRQRGKQVEARRKLRELTRGGTAGTAEEELVSRLNSLPRPVRGAIDGIMQLSPFTARQIIKELGPGGLLHGEGREGTDLFKQLKAVGEAAMKDPFEKSIQKQAEGAKDGTGILSGLKAINTARANLIKANKKGVVDMQALKSYQDAIGKRGGALTGEKFKPTPITTSGETFIIEQQRKSGGATPRRRLPQGLPEELQGEQSNLGTGDGKVVAIVKVENRGPAIKKEDISATVEFRRHQKGIESALG